MALVLLILSIVEEFDRVAITVLGPDIQESLNISDTMLLGLGSFGGSSWSFQLFPSHG